MLFQVYFRRCLTLEGLHFENSSTNVVWVHSTIDRDVQDEKCQYLFEYLALFPPAKCENSAINTKKKHFFVYSTNYVG